MELIIKGSVLQLILALFILKVPFVSTAFDWLAKAFTKVIDFSHEGAIFLFGSMGEMPPILKLAFWILPTVVFVSSSFEFNVLFWCPPVCSQENGVGYE